MATKNLNIRIDEDVKKQAEKIFAEIGIPMATAMNVFLRQAIRCGGFPFDLKLDAPNAETIAAIDDVNNNRNMSKTFDSVSSLMEDLDA